MKEKHKDILKAIKFDPLGEAEKITGNHHQQDENTAHLGLLLQIEKSKMLDDLLSDIDDTKLSNKLSDYLAIVIKFGFKIVYTEDFANDNGRPEKMYLLWHYDLSILLCFDTFTWEFENEPNVNSGNIYYNWSPHGGTQTFSLTSSGGFFNEKNNKSHLTLFEKDLSTPYHIPDYPSDPKYNDSIPWDEYKAILAPIEDQQRMLFDKALRDGKRAVWVGDHDCREAIITKMKALFENGIFVREWKKCAFPWLTNYMDHRGGSSKYPFTDLYEKTKAIISKLPPDVQKCIGIYRP